MKFFADMCKSMNVAGFLTVDDLYNLSEKEVIEKMKNCKDEYLSNAFNDLLPKSLIPVFLKILPVPPDKFVHQITKEERGLIVDLLKNFTVTVTKTRPLAEAIVTAGGVNLKEVNPKTLESKIVQGLYFAGEVLDIDGFTGGFNLQAAFSTGYAAGFAAAE